jgi:alcohol dehydrogenase (cytochrome c)
MSAECCRPGRSPSAARSSADRKSQPLIHDGILYVTGSYSRIYAIDVKTGEKIWQYDARLPEGILPCCDVVNRGAAILGDKVYFGTLDAKLVALTPRPATSSGSRRSATTKPAIPIRPHP